MHVQHSNPHTSSVGHNGHQWEALRDGIFNVPDEVGEALLAHPGWTRYYGEAAYEVSSAPAPTPEDETPAPGATSSAEPPPPAPPAGEPIDWFAKGEEAARAGAPRLPLPDELKDRPRHRDARTYLAGHDSVTQADPPA